MVVIDDRPAACRQSPGAHGIQPIDEGVANARAITRANGPPQHHIGKKSFLKNNAGAIPSNVITMANTHSISGYQEYCREHDLQPHPARMPLGLAEFFIKFLTKPNMLVLDPFGGSNTTGAAARSLAGAGSPSNQTKTISPGHADDLTEIFSHERHDGYNPAGA